MDSHVFRVIAEELADLLCGARMEKIYGPVPGVFVFTVFAREAKRQLLLRYERQSPLLFFVSRRLSNPERPPAQVMRLRKYCAGRRLGQGTVDFASRCIAFPVAAPLDREHTGKGHAAVPSGQDDAGKGKGRPAGEQTSAWLMLDMRAGPDVVFSLPQGFGSDPAWPEPGIADALCDKPWNRKETQGPWQDYAVLTPFLRETLAALDPMEGRALLVDLEAGGGELFAYADAAGQPVLYSAWPLPDAVCARRGLTPLVWSGRRNISEGEAASLSPGLALVSVIDEARFFTEFGNRVRKEEYQPAQKENKRITRLLGKLDQEEARLRAMAELRRDACALQEILWQYPPDARLESVRVSAGPEEAGRMIVLNPLLTLRENMARMFHSSDRGARGLEHLRQRREDVLAGSSGVREEHRALSESGSGVSVRVPGEAAGHARTAANDGGPECSVSSGGPKRMPDPGPSGGQRGRGKNGEGKTVKDVARFISSDGFTMLRGKSARGNQALLKLGQAHDLWLHALDGPSAHLIIRRAHPAEEIPDRTLLEAAALVGEKSWQRHDSRAHVMVALLRHVHAIKGAAPGTVKVDAVLRTVTAVLEEKAFQE